MDSITKPSNQRAKRSKDGYAATLCAAYILLLSTKLTAGLLQTEFPSG